MPRDLRCGQEKLDLADPCKILFHVKLKEEGNSHIEELIGFQMQRTLSCHIANVIWGADIQMDISKFTYKVEVSIDDAELKSVFKVEEEQYEL
jgi:hypothetical protein